MVAALLVANGVQAQSGSNRTDTRAGGGIAVGPFRMTPSLGLTLGYDSNVALSDTGTISSFFTRVSPGIRLDNGNERSRVSASYQGDYSHFSDSSRDNYDDHRFGLQWLYNPVLRHAFALDAQLGYLHDQRGSAAREGELGLLPLDPDEYRASSLGGKYAFGAPGARGRAEVEARAGRIEYRNNREFTAFRDRDDRFLAGTFYWRVAPKTSAVARVEQGKFDYDDATLDNTERHVLVGLEFDATAKTSGQVLFGRAKKDFDDATREDFSGTSWRMAVQYRPRTYSVVDISTGRDTDETNGFGDYILRRDWTLGWAHNWNERFRTTVDGGFANEQHRPSGREDDVNFYGLSADYTFRPWLRFGASWRTYDRDSDFEGLDYGRDLYMISAEASL